MKSERGIIIIGDCRSEKLAMMQQALKHCSDIHFKESIEEVKKLNHHFETTVAISYNFRDELEKLAELEKTIKLEKPQSKFISRPRHNFRKR
jgi:hypothetical protein